MDTNFVITIAFTLALFNSITLMVGGWIIWTLMKRIHLLENQVAILDEMVKTLRDKYNNLQQTVLHMIDTSLGPVYEKINNLTNQLNGLEKQVAALQKATKRLETGPLSHGSRASTSTNWVKDRHERNATNKELEEIRKKVDGINYSLTNISLAVQGVTEKDLPTVTARIEGLSKCIKAITDRINGNDERLNRHRESINNLIKKRTTKTIT